MADLEKRPWYQLRRLSMLLLANSGPCFSGLLVFLYIKVASLPIAISIVNRTLPLQFPELLCQSRLTLLLLDRVHSVHAPEIQDEALNNLFCRNRDGSQDICLRFLLWTGVRGRPRTKRPPDAARSSRLTRRPQSTSGMGPNQFPCHSKSFVE